MSKLNDTQFGRQVARARIRYSHVGSTMESVEQLLTLGDMNAAVHAAFELAFQGEKLALQLRLMPAVSGKRFAKEKIERQVKAAIPIMVGMTAEGFFGLRFPALLPKKEKGSAEYIRHSLYIALGDYFKKHDRARYRECVLVLRHVYDSKRPERQWRDHDNIEVNAVVDAAALFVLRDDSAKSCSHFYCSLAGDRDETQMLIIPKEQFADWYPNAESASLILF